MNEQILKYIKNEKELAEYNISMLKRRKITPARKRVIEIEKEFLNLPLNKMSFSSVEEVKKAISLYKKSRRKFYSKYKIENSNEMALKVSKKISFLDKTSSNLKSKRIIQINPVQDEDIYQEIIKYFACGVSLEDLKEGESSKDKVESELSHKSLKELQSIEPAIIAKKRARLQTSIYSLGEYIEYFIDNELNFESKSIIDFNLVNSKIDFFIFNLEKFIFNFYNKSLDKIPKVIKNTMGANRFIKKIHKLDNVFSFYENIDVGTHVYTIDKKTKIYTDNPWVGNIYMGYKNAISSSYNKDSERNTKNSVYGILFPIKRISREKMTPLDIKIYHSEIDITKLFLSTISNIKIKDENDKEVYYKGLLMKPLWKLLDYSKNNKKYKSIISKMIDENINDLGKFNNKDFIKYFNKKKTSFLKIDCNSKILVPQTRSEEEYLKEILPLSHKRINDIKNDYKNIM